MTGIFDGPSPRSHHALKEQQSFRVIRRQQSANPFAALLSALARHACVDHRDRLRRVTHRHLFLQHRRVRHVAIDDEQHRIVCTSPFVMLSPNARNFTALMVGTNGTSVTLNCVTAERTPSVADAVRSSRPAESSTRTAEQQVIFTGGMPPVVVGVGYVTTCDEPMTFATCTSAGCWNAIGWTGSGPGPPELWPHAARIEESGQS